MEENKDPKLIKLESLLDFRYLLRKVLKLWWLFLVVGLTLGLAGYLYAKFSPVRYKSHLTFVLDDGNFNSNSIISLASELGLNTGTQGSEVFNGDNIINILKSRRIVESVLLITDTLEGRQQTYIGYYLQKIQFYKNNKHQSLHFPAGLRREQLSYTQDSLLKTIYNNFSQNLITVDRPDKRLNIYQLEIVTPFENFTKKFTDELVKASNNFYTELRTKKSKQTLEILEERSNEIKNNLNASIAGRALVQDVNLNPAFSKAQIPVTRQQTNIQVYGAAYAEIFKNLEMARFQYLNAKPIMQIIDEANFPMEKVQKSSLLTALILAICGGLLLFIYLWGRRVFTLSVDNS